MLEIGGIITMKLELHTHTYYSHHSKLYYDGLDSPENMIKSARKNGLDAIAITDHDTLEGVLKARKMAKKAGIDVIVGEEVSTRSGHVLAINIQETVRPGLSVKETADIIRQQGGICIAAHPFDYVRDSIGKESVHCDAVETFNAGNINRLSDIRAGRFAKKYNKPATVGSDAHSTQMLDHGVIEVDADDTDGALKSIMKGDSTFHKKYFTVGDVREYAIQRIKMSHGHTMVYIDRAHRWPIRPIGKKLMTALAEGRMKRSFTVFSYLALSGYLVYSSVKTLMGFRPGMPLKKLHYAKKRY